MPGPMMAEDDDRPVLAVGREAEVLLQPDGTVLKLMWDAAGAAAVEREEAVCRLLAAHGQRCPVVHEVVQVDGRPGLVMDRIVGTSLLAQLERRPLRVLAAARMMAAAHAAMHECPAPVELPELRAQLEERLRAAAPLPPHLRDRALRLLEGLPDGDRLCHNDFHLGNILGTWDAPVVIDWGYACRGEPMADVARTELLHRVAAMPPGTPPLFRAVARVGRQLLTSRYLAHYERHRPLHDTRAHWYVVQAAARLAEPIPEEHPALLRTVESSPLMAP